jgi:hypothetical protein
MIPIVTNIYYKLMGIIHLGAGKDGESVCEGLGTHKIKALTRLLARVKAIILTT